MLIGNNILCWCLRSVKYCPLSMCVCATWAGTCTEWEEDFTMTSTKEFCWCITTETEQGLYTEAESRPSVAYQISIFWSWNLQLQMYLSCLFSIALHLRNVLWDGQWQSPVDISIFIVLLINLPLIPFFHLFILTQNWFNSFI